MQQLQKFRVFFLNISRIVISYIYLKPQKFIRDTFSKKSLNIIIAPLYNPDQSDEIKALSAAFGVFMGIIPIWGFQTLVAIFFAVVFRLNKVLVVIFSHISFPPMMPLVIFLSYRAGGYWMKKTSGEIMFNSKMSLLTVNKNMEQYIIGSITLAVIAAISIGLITFVMLKLVKILKQFKITASLKKTA
jgi:uncharacterized protein (DUF2062 family)